MSSILLGSRRISSRPRVTVLRAGLSGTDSFCARTCCRLLTLIRRLLNTSCCIFVFSGDNIFGGLLSALSRQRGGGGVDMRSVSYVEMRDSLMTGDIVLFHGLGWDSDVIQILEQSQWTHVGMVVRVPELEYPLIWESFPFEYVEDVILHKRKSGARLVSLDERLAVGIQRGLFDTVAIRRLKVVRTPAMITALRDFIYGMFHTLPYPGDWEMLIEYLLGRFFKEEKTETSEVQCAELVAETYKQMGLLPPDILSNSFVPKDFSSDGQLQLLKDADLEEECILILERGEPSPDE